MGTLSVLLRVALAVVLLTAAGLKLAAISRGTISSSSLFARLEWQLLLICGEVLLSGWLLSGRGAVGAWWAAVGVFGIFAVVSGYGAVVGVASCGCWGVVDVSPWWSLVVDGLAVVGLLVVGPQLAVTWPVTLETLGVRLMGVGGVSGLVAVFSIGWFGSAEAALARLRGESLWVTPYVDMGRGRPGEVLESTVRVTNTGEQPVRLIGGTSDCFCIAVEDFPLTIEPQQSAVFRVQLRLIATGTGQLTRVVVVRTDSINRPELQFRVVCRIVH